MATTMTLTELMKASRQRADMAPSGYTPDLTTTTYFVTEPELISYINQSYFELYDILCQKYGDDYYVASPVSITTDGITPYYSLPDGTLYSSAPAFYKLLGVDLALSTAQDQWQTLRPFSFGSRNRLSIPNIQTTAGTTNLRYRLKGSQLWLNPLPASGQVVRLWYVPRLTTLAALSDTADGISGWTEYVIVDAAIKCLQKEESDVSVLMAQKNALIARIESAAENRDAGMPATVSDVSDSSSQWATEQGWSY